MTDRPGCGPLPTASASRRRRAGRHLSGSTPIPDPARRAQAGGPSIGSPTVPCRCAPGSPPVACRMRRHTDASAPRPCPTDRPAPPPRLRGVRPSAFASRLRRVPVPPRPPAPAHRRRPPPGSKRQRLHRPDCPGTTSSPARRALPDGIRARSTSARRPPAGEPCRASPSRNRRGAYGYTTAPPGPGRSSAPAASRPRPRRCFR